MNDENQEYKKEFYCHNCGEYFTKWFKCGTIAVKGACSFCGVTDQQLSVRGIE